MCSRPSGRAWRAAAATRAGRSKNEPSAIAASIRGRSWRTGRPAPEVEVPDLGVAHLARRQADGVLGRAEGRVRPARESPRQIGIGAAAIASAAGSRPIPKPSRTTRTIGRGRRVDALAHPVTAAPRAAAVSPARATIPAISSGLSDAPPTSAPSMAGSARNSSMFAEVTLPPYRTGTSAARRVPAEPVAGRPGSRRPSPPRPRRWRSARCRSPRPARRR